MSKNAPVIALLGQPNSGKSTVFNMITGSHQHVGNWPGKTVDQKEGEFKWNGKQMILADLPGSYSLSAGSDEEIITKDYITSGNADLVLVMADASQLKRSLYMLADFVGSQVPAVLILNMIDVAKGQGITINTEKLSSKLGIPVVPMSAIRKKDYQQLYETIEKSLIERPVINSHSLNTAKEKLNFIDSLLDGVLETSKTARNAFTKFDQTALSPVKGKLMAFGIILVIFLLAMIFSGIISGIASAVLTPLASVLRSLMVKFQVHTLLISLICDVLVNVLYFALMMASFVLGITLGFNLMEETGYLARISFLFDHTMSKVGLQGKTIMPFFMGLGCTIAGTTGTRVVDNWGQRVLAIAMSWAVPCAATLSVVPTIAIALFGSNGGFLVIVSIFLFMFLMMWAVYKIFGNSLSPKEERVGLIMELPPYHKPDFRNIMYVTFQRTFDIFCRALRVISIVSIVFFALTYGFGGNAENSILYKIGVIIEPVTMFFGLKWQAFLAFCASAISKESLLGVLNTLYGAGGSLVSSTFGAKAAGNAADFSLKHPTVEVKIMVGSHEELYRAMENNTVDLVLNDQRRAFSDMYHNEILSNSHMYVEISKHNPLSRLDKIEISELKNTPCILVINSAGQQEEQEYYEDIVGIRGDFLFADSVQEARLKIITGQGYMLVDVIGNPAWFDSTIARIPLARNGETVRKTYCAFWRKDNFGYYIEDFAEILKTMF